MRGQEKKFAVSVIGLLLLLLPACGQKQSVPPEQMQQTPALVMHTAAQETDRPAGTPEETEPLEETGSPEETGTPEETENPEEIKGTTKGTAEGAGDGPQSNGGQDGQQKPELGGTPDDVFPVDRGPAVITVLSPEASGTLTKESDQAVIDYSHTEDGYVMVRWTGGADARVKVLIKGPSGTTYQYNLDLYGSYETFPLSDGSGSYNVGVYRNAGGTQYATIMTLDVGVSLRDEFAPFLRPNQYVNFTRYSLAVQKAGDLCAGITDNLEKTAAVYDYVVNNVTYDTAKAQTVQSGYLPDIDDTYRTGRGICFDYAALMAGMLRSQSVPVKLVIGYTGSAYHAWLSVYSQTDGWMNAQIYFDGNTWKLMDPTFASSGGQSDSIMQYIGNGANYQAKYLY